MPKSIDDGDDNAMQLDEILAIINEDISNDFERAISLLECTPETDADSVCRALMYAFEKQGKSLVFLLKLIAYEVENSDSATTLFRNNCFASKCFKVYARMIGLPYLFRVLFPVIKKLYKEEQNDTIEVKGSIDMKPDTSSGYELSFDTSSGDEDLAYDASIEENALLIQVACEEFFKSLTKAKKYLPEQFNLISNTIEIKVHQKYPNCPIDIYIATFIFLRYFVAGISVPESFGIIEKRPNPIMRRRLILISKVLSNMSTGVKFGEKEDYMVIMNSYLESKRKLLEKYYKFLCSDINTHVKNDHLNVPDKYYNASLTVLSYAFEYQNRGVWVKETDCFS